jgi:hypothetical protein
MPEPTREAPAPSLKGQAVELWREGSRFFAVADEADAQEAMKRFSAHRGEIWTPGEIELVARIEDQSLRDEVAGFKREMDGRLSSDAASAGVSLEDWKAVTLNRLFQDQGVSGEPGRITAATVRHGERKSKQT